MTDTCPSNINSKFCHAWTSQKRDTKIHDAYLQRNDSHIIFWIEMEIWLLQYYGDIILSRKVYARNIKRVYQIGKAPDFKIEQSIYAYDYMYIYSNKIIFSPFLRIDYVDKIRPGLIYVHILPGFI